MKKIVVSILSEIRPEFDFDKETNFISGGFLDSFDLVSLVTSLDEQFGISIDGTDILPENFETIGAIENLLRKNGVQ
ncbi:acyl carrier protein [Flavobacterium covae]|uniref:acyl carrier protein n=1 Tax=Flavobacterium covae TaxID=2906076 RepID=UPI000B5B6316|nr:acyl carrier protein [Flavobacterium covae]MCJ1805907.1 acyl carrier protein [Flavobacterium covae]OXA80187.1 acyl carrier protein [Flavobacterium columnare] [Flavobacterium columnare NBRC 100251 = ATCC 23463]